MLLGMRVRHHQRGCNMYHVRACPKTRAGADGSKTAIDASIDSIAWMSQTRERKSPVRKHGKSDNVTKGNANQTGGKWNPEGCSKWSRHLHMVKNHSASTAAHWASRKYRHSCTLVYMGTGERSHRNKLRPTSVKLSIRPQESAKSCAKLNCLRQACTRQKRNNVKSGR